MDALTFNLIPDDTTFVFYDMNNKKFNYNRREKNPMQ